MNKALFIDRDGTIIRDTNYVCDPSLVELLPGAREALGMALDLGYLLFLFTNQSGIGRGYFSWATAWKVHERMEALLDLRRPVFTEICMVPETPRGPQAYRKPSPRFILEMTAKYELDRRLCFMVGDAASDIMAGINAGVTPIAVATGKGAHPSTLPEVREHEVRVFPSLRDFVASLY